MIIERMHKTEDRRWQTEQPQWAAHAPRPNDLQSFLDLAGTMFVAMDPKGYITLINRKGCELLGCDHSEVVGRNWFDNFVPPNERRRVKKVFRLIMSGNVTLVENYENPIITKGGEERLILWHNAVMRDALGNITGAFSSGMDITERKANENRLRESRTKYSTLVENANDGVVVLQDGVIKFTNPMMLKMSGFSTEDDLYGKNFLAFVAPEFRILVQEFYAQRLSGKKVPQRYELKLLSKDGKPLAVEVSGSLIEYEGRPADMVVVRDITERRKADDALRASEERLLENVSLLNSIMHSTADGLLVIDVGGKVVFHNEQFRKLWRMPPKLVKTKDDKKLLAYAVNQLAEPEEFLKKVNYLYAHLAEESFDTIRFKDGRVFERYSMPQKRGERIIGRVWSFRDATKRKSAEMEVLKRNAELERAYGGLKALNTIREDFTNTISHALKTPLTSIMSFVSLMKDGKTGQLTELQSEAIAAIESESNRLFMLVNNILDSSRVETDTFRIIKRRDDLRSVVEMAIRRLSTSAKAHGNKMGLQSPAKLYASFDRSWIEKVLDNVISNSIKFTKNGEILIKLQKTDDAVRFSLTDTGKGITDTALPHIFDKYFQGHQQTGTGTGLGLYISKRVIDAHGGRIGAKSNGPEKGATIWFTLPYMNHKK